MKTYAKGQVTGNAARAERGKLTLADYDSRLDREGLDTMSADEVETLAQDLITDILHYFDTLKEHPLGDDKDDQRSRAYGVMRRAFDNYAAEEAGDE